MRRLRTSVSCLVLLAGMAAISISASSTASANVCGIKADGPKNYDTPRAAKMDGARVMHPGECQSVLCMGWMAETTILYSAAICGTDPLNHQMMTYPNVCAEEHAAANFVHAGPCKPKR
jgi:hypothetical protein